MTGMGDMKPKQPRPTTGAVGPGWPGLCMEEEEPVEARSVVDAGKLKRIEDLRNIMESMWMSSMTLGGKTEPGRAKPSTEADGSSLAGSRDDSTGPRWQPSSTGREASGHAKDLIEGEESMADAPEADRDGSSFAAVVVLRLAPERTGWRAEGAGPRRKGSGTKAAEPMWCMDLKEGGGPRWVQSMAGSEETKPGLCRPKTDAEGPTRPGLCDKGGRPKWPRSKIKGARLERARLRANEVLSKLAASKIKRGKPTCAGLRKGGKGPISVAPGTGKLKTGPKRLRPTRGMPSAS